MEGSIFLPSPIKSPTFVGAFTEIIGTMSSAMLFSSYLLFTSACFHSNEPVVDGIFKVWPAVIVSRAGSVLEPIYDIAFIGIFQNQC